jgi:hypothetical protein
MYGRDISAQLDRIGQTATLYEKEQIGENEFNNTEFGYVENREVTCVRTYPNRNTENEGSDGEYESDRALFIFARGDDEPSGEERLEYDGQMYALGSTTEYETHVSIFGNKVT